ncbi:acyl-CoA synthetase [Nocardioides jiangxiensis]|uniref:Acyl-CoA synthetase n=1 Tax=Nocardioides jiangxiensis TaxID=3064524 RepID=A0ABT9AXJ1_9ACTN|nr:acyl-CoA synthetase [Nocardioides sp. WY-20]MDO7867260.1 acyl-CoA synthetase [Nocardioides sp. WY-20]
MSAALWPPYAGFADLPHIEKVPLAERDLPPTTFDLLRRAAFLWPAKVAASVLPDASRWKEHVDLTYGDLYASVVRYANALHELGVRRGNAVGLMSTNCASLIPATLAAQVAGIAAPVNPGLNPEHAATLLERSGTAVLIAAGPELDASIWTTALDIARSGGVSVLLALRPTDATGPAPDLPAVEGVLCVYLDDLAAVQAASAFAGQEPAADDIASVFHTGGTTGIPKLAAHTHANEVADAWMIAANYLLDDDDAIFAALPLFHVNALVVTTLAPLFRGQRVVWAGPLGYRDFALYAEIWRIVEAFRIATMSAVPTVYQVLAQCPVDADISSMAFAVAGASALPRAVAEAFTSSTGVPLVEGYGLTEATCASIRSFPDDVRPGSVGQRMPYQQVKVVKVEADGSWTDLPAGETGLLVIGGPTVFPGYVVGHDGTGPVLDDLGKLKDGWLDTGDLARIDAEGFVYLTGRAKDLIIRGGHNIDPSMIEDALLTHPEVVAAAAVGRPDAYAGEVPVAYVTLAVGARTSAEELRAWAAAAVPEKAAAPKVVEIRDALPVTDVGKPYKLPLRADALRDEVARALEGVPEVNGVDGVVVDGSVEAVVYAEPDVDEARVAKVLGAYALTWRLHVTR